MILPVHSGVVSQLPLPKQDTVADPDRMYPLLQLYVTLPPKVVLDGLPEVPSEMVGGEPQSTTAVEHQRLKIVI